MTMPEDVLSRCLRDRMHLVKQAVEDAPAELDGKDLTDTLAVIVNRCKMMGVPDASLAEVLYALKSLRSLGPSRSAHGCG